jgi:16S rRNA pseudouridine516 synthase
LPRLDALLARNLGWSRPAGRAAMADDRIAIAGATASDPRRDVGAGELPLAAAVDGAPVTLVDVARVLLNKPIGCVTALRDARHPTAYALLRSAPLHGELRPVGRLDIDTSGLLLWTTDGAEIQRLTHPKRAVPRTYQAALANDHGPLPAALVLEDGHRPHITDLSPLARADAHPSLDVPADARALASITIAGGAYHEVRRIFVALGSHVLALCRVRFGSFDLPRDLAPGAFRLLGPQEDSHRESF